MVTLQGAPIPVPEGEPALLYGIVDNITHPVCAVKLDDGCEVLIAREYLQVLS